MKHGFSLVELSIVLVILGLLTGGILAGQNLIRAAELRSVSTEASHYITAVQTFRDKYFALPGDMPNATDFWGAADADPTTCGTTQGTGTETCNGDGDGDIDVIFNSTTDSAELFRFWQQLANAGLVEGSYTGLNGSVGNDNDANIRENVPASKLTNAGWAVRYNVGTGTGVAFAGPDGNHINFGADNGTDGNVQAAILTPEEAWNIDTKMDDGKPGIGKVNALQWDDCTNAATNGSANDDEVTADYLLSDPSTTCSLRFISEF